MSLLAVVSDFQAQCSAYSSCSRTVFRGIVTVSTVNHTELHANLCSLVRDCLTHPFACFTSFLIECNTSAQVLHSAHTSTVLGILTATTWMYPRTEHDTENLNFSKEFHGCSAQAPVDSCVKWHNSSARVPRIFCAGRREFCAGGCGFSVRTGTNLPCGFRLKMETRRQTLCTTMLKDRETHCKHRSNYNCKYRTYVDMKY